MKYRLLNMTSFISLGILATVGCVSVPDRPVMDNGWNDKPQLLELERTVDSKKGLPVLTEQSSLSDYLAYAALNNPGLESAFNRWKAAIERIPQVTSLPDPKFSYTYFIEELETRTGPQRQRFGLAQMFPWFGTLELRGDVAVELANVEKERYEAEKLSLFYRVKDAYYEYYYLSREIAVTKEMFDLLTYLETVARTRYAVGSASNQDVIKAQVELGKLEDRLNTLRDFRVPLAARLNAALNRPEQTPLPWPDSIPLDRVEFTDAQVMDWLAQHNPDLKAIDYLMAKEEKSVKLAEKDFYPDFTFGINYMETGDARMPNTRGSSDDPVAVMLSIDVPIWRQKYRAGMLEAKARYDAAELQRHDKENMLKSQAEMVLYRFRDAERKINLYHDTLIPKANQSLNVAQQTFAAGKLSFLDVLDAERTLLEFKLAYERAFADRAQRLAELEMIVGRELPGKSATKGGQ
ncbi:MAG: TolC family protein [Candidatus Hydrogenedentes bacterium]|nr:TolC family protein [Candidatus Hydrogenedentota bacterium]